MESKEVGRKVKERDWERRGGGRKDSVLVQNKQKTKQKKATTHKHMG